MAAPQEFGTGILARVTKQTYWMLALTACLALAVAVPCGVSIFLDRDASNIPLFAVMVWACAPGVSAAFSPASSAPVTWTTVRSPRSFMDCDATR